jgi:hypothetical protein
VHENRQTLSDEGKIRKPTKTEDAVKLAKGKSEARLLGRLGKVLVLDLL